MIPRVTQCGRSFKGAYQYFGHDKELDTRDRVAWVETANMLTRDPDKAWKVMAYTAKVQDRLKEASGMKATGRKLQKPVFSYSLAWHPEQNPDRDHMLETARESLAALGLSEHECMIIAHRDEPQKHVHILVNRVHPISGIARNLGNSKRRLSDFAHAYEKAHGKIYCKQREQNRMKREKGERAKYGDLNIRQAWDAAVKGEKSFGEALKERGYHLAQGEKRIVVVDPQGKIHDPARHIEGVRGKDVKTLIGEFARVALPNADAVSQTMRDEYMKTYRKQQTEMKRREEAVASLKKRQQQERMDAELHHHRMLVAEENNLSRQFRMKERGERIAQTEAKVKTARWWRKLFGFTKRDKETLEKLVGEYQNYQDRISKRLEVVQRNFESNCMALNRRHERELQKLHERQHVSLIREQIHELSPKREKSRDFGR